ncbi:MAG: (Fe-S)-binding protein [Bacteroidota bacterium]
MEYIDNILFTLLLVGGFTFFGLQLKKIRRNIMLGMPLNRSDRKADRWKLTALVAMGQSKMVTRPLAGILHIFIYVAFVITQIELLEIIIDGISGSHRAIYFAVKENFLGSIYTFTINMIEILSVLAFFATIIFLSRRNIVKLARFQMPEMKGWPSKDANIILALEIYLVVCIFMMNGADVALQNLGVNPETGNFIISSHFAGHLAGTSEATLHIIEKIGWWGHFLGIVGFLVYLPISKHLHILISFPNVFYSNLDAKGKFTNLESVTTEVKLMLDPNAPAPAADAPPAKFGAKDVTDLSWVQLMNAYSCTECGRCSSVCPQNQTGKKLSPRKIMMDTRDRLEEVSKNIDTKGKDFIDGKSLLGDYITEEELWACNTCNACVEACPVNIDPLSIIVDLRRYLVMEQSSAPAPIAGMLTNIENNGAPWQFSPSDRANWIKES